MPHIRTASRVAALLGALALSAGLPLASAETPEGVPSASAAASSAPPSPAIALGTVPDSACGTPLSADEIARIVAVTAPPAASGPPSLADLEARAGASADVTTVLLSHGDRRAIFGEGLDLVERDAVLPLYERSAASPPAAPATGSDGGSDGAGIAALPWAVTLSSHLLDGYLDALHAHFSGAPVAPHWQNYFERAADCAIPGGYAAMAGYNAHLTVDLAHAVATSGTTLQDYGDYLAVVGSIADRGDAIVATTRASFDADLAPLWRLYFLGDVADGLSGMTSGSTGIPPGDGHALLLRTADQGYSTLSFANGLALAAPETAPVGAASVQTAWTLANESLGTLATHGFL